MLVCAFPEPPCSLLSHPGLPGQRLPPRVPGGAGTPAATGARPRAARCAWDRRLLRGVQLLPAPIPQGSTTPVQLFYSSPPSPADSTSFQPTRAGEGALLAASGTLEALPDTPGWLLRVLQ